jgi:hypothetical protein
MTMPKCWIIKGLGVSLVVQKARETLMVKGFSRRQQFWGFLKNYTRVGGVQLLF